MDEAVSDTESNTCATFYVTADNSSQMAYLLQLYVNERIQTDLWVTSLHITLSRVSTYWKYTFIEISADYV
jgi:hypothetical protein